MLELRGEGASMGRAYVTRFTDVWSAGRSCPEPTSEAVDIVSGSVTVDALDGRPTERHGEATLVTAEGGTISLSF